MNTWVKIFIGLAAAGVVAALVVYTFIYNKPHPDFEKKKADYKIEASALFDAYKADATAASKQYNGKVVELSGNLSSVEEADTLVVAIFAFGEGMFGAEGVRVTMLPKFNQALLSHPIGEKITLKGFCSGYNDTDVIIEKGSVVQ